MSTHKKKQTNNNSEQEKVKMSERNFGTQKKMES